MTLCASVPEQGWIAAAAAPWAAERKHGAARGSMSTIKLSSCTTPRHMGPHRPQRRRQDGDGLLGLQGQTELHQPDALRLTLQRVPAATPLAPASAPIINPHTHLPLLPARPSLRCRQPILGSLEMALMEGFFPLKNSNHSKQFNNTLEEMVYKTYVCAA